MENTSRDVLVEILPETLHFGKLCVGFTYQLTVSLLNKAPRPQRFKVQCTSRKFSRKTTTDGSERSNSNPIKATYDSSPVAPGLSTIVVLELKAECLGVSEYELVVTQSLSSAQVSKPITARIISLDAFRSISQALPNKDAIYAPGVKPVPVPAEKPPAPSSPRETAPASPESHNTLTGKPLASLPSAASLITESLLGEEDIDDLIAMPMLFNQYWDPIELKLMIDPALSKVLVNEKWTVSESQQNTYAMRFVLLSASISCSVMFLF